MSGEAPEQPGHTHAPDPSGGEAPAGVTPWTIADSIFVLLLWLVAIIFIGGAILIALQAMFRGTQSDALTLPLTALMLIGITIGYVHLRYRGSAWLLFGRNPPTWRSAGYGVAAGVLLLAAIAFGLGELIELLVRAIGGELPEIQEDFREIAGDRAAAPLLVFGSVLVAPLAEELFYRGMLFPALRRRMDLWPAMGISGVLFGLSHLQTTLEGYLLVLLIIIPLGMFLAWIYERTGTLLVPILAHSTFNLVQVIVLIMQESGGGSASL